MWLGLAVFMTAVALDYASGRYLQAATSRHVHKAALWSITMALLSTVGLLSVVEVSWWYIVPESLGLYVGTLLSFRVR